MARAAALGRMAVSRPETGHRFSTIRGYRGLTATFEQVIDRDRPEPLYLQIKSWMLRQIEAGRWPVHYKLPAEEDLAADLGVSRGTLRQALRKLVALGRLSQMRGKGTFVTADHLEQPLAENLITISEDLMRRHIPFETQVLEQSVIHPPDDIASMLAIPPQGTVLLLKRLRSIDGKPVVLLANFVALSHCPGIEHVDFTRYRLFEALENLFGLELDWGRRTFQAQVAGEATAGLLGIPPSDPVMYLEQVVYLRNRAPIELSNVWFHGQRFKLSATLKRIRGTYAPSSVPTYVPSPVVLEDAVR